MSNQNWDYAELSKSAKAAGGPEEYIRIIEREGWEEGVRDGRIEATVFIGLCAGCIWGSAKLIDCWNEKRYQRYQRCINKIEKKIEMYKKQIAEIEKANKNYEESTELDIADADNTESMEINQKSNEEIEMHVD